MHSSLKESIYQKTFKNMKIVVSDINGIAVLGAASLCFDSMNLKGTKLAGVKSRLR